MNIQYDPHARLRMSQRNINEAEVLAVLTNPEISRPGRAPRLICTAHPNGKFVKVVYELRGDVYYVITVGD